MLPSMTKICHLCWVATSIIKTNDNQVFENRSTFLKEAFLGDSTWADLPAMDIGDESVPKIVINDTIKVFFLNCKQDFGNFKPQQFPSAD